jgi:hypothetical protein
MFPGIDMSYLRSNPIFFCVSVLTGLHWLVIVSIASEFAFLASRWLQLESGGSGILAILSS